MHIGMWRRAWTHRKFRIFKIEKHSNQFQNLTSLISVNKIYWYISKSKRTLKSDFQTETQPSFPRDYSKQFNDPETKNADPDEKKWVSG